ncbi:hypothetical protein B296_00054196 [Ensete ventricosum]|uniref:Uncharacterized protein n=1 Tax=Ensete ventricosum TaxID=4639 RepID=A0A426Y4W0_ENSVE|nr:hypothetical protein B296_00054196 [Ensete ventricosum]
MDSMYRFGSTPLRGPPTSGRYCVSSREGTRCRLIFQQENETTPCLLTRERGTTSFSRGETRRRPRSLARRGEAMPHLFSFF